MLYNASRRNDHILQMMLLLSTWRRRSTASIADTTRCRHSTGLKRHNGSVMMVLLLMLMLLLMLVMVLMVLLLMMVSMVRRAGTSRNEPRIGDGCSIVMMIAR